MGRGRNPGSECSVELEVALVSVGAEVVQVGGELGGLGRVEDAGPVEISHVLDAVVAVVDFGDGVHQRRAGQLHLGEAVVGTEYAFVSGDVEYGSDCVFVVDEPVRTEFYIVVVVEVSHHGVGFLLVKSKSGRVRIGYIVYELHRIVVEALVNAEQGADFLGAVVEIEPETLLPRGLAYFAEVHCTASKSEGTVESLEDGFLGFDVDDSALSCRIVLGGRMFHQFESVYAFTVGAAKQGLEAFAVNIGWAAVNPYLDALAVEFDVAVLVDGYSRGFFDQVKCVAALGEGALGDIHYHLVDLHFDEFDALGDLCLAEHLGIDGKGYGFHSVKSRLQGYFQRGVAVSYH